MKSAGIICEYNPFHLGHARQFSVIRERMGQDTAIICLMSGNFVQRGRPGIYGKGARARAAVGCGADLVLELPVTCALSSAEGFAAGGVEILTACGADTLCFGAESGGEGVMETAERLLDPAFSGYLRKYLDQGVSFPAARAQALAEMGGRAEILERPNDILAVEYCKAILRQGSPMTPMAIHRPGDYHARTAEGENPSATALRGMICRGEDWTPYVPAAAAAVFAGETVHTMAAGERAVLARLRTMTDGEFEALPYGGEGLWRRFMTACRERAGLEEIIQTTKSKRYTRTRLDRMVMCAFLGLTREDLEQKAPYVRVLALNDRGRQILRDAREQVRFVNAGDRPAGDYYAMERRCGDLYGLFAVPGPEPPGREDRERVFYASV